MSRDEPRAPMISSAPPTEEPQPVCPVGVRDCPFPAGIGELRRQLGALAQEVRTDPLTRVANYRSFREHLDQELERSGRNGRPTGLLMIDIDHFKKVNDVHGHEIGNLALVHVAGVISRQVRKLDTVCRYGGEEFAVILPETDLNAGIPVAERIRLALADTPVPITEGALSLTASLGLATYYPLSPVPAEELIKQADQYLYQAKQQGRNQVRHPEPPQPVSVSNEEKQTLLGLLGKKPSTKD